MPIYDLRCRDCGNARDVQTDDATATSLELVCTACGGVMTKVPSRVAVVASLGSAAPSSSTTLPGPAAEPAGHDTCRAAIRLSRPNPFASPLVSDPRKEG
jgi:putative FmdB family regulatory protein